MKDKELREIQQQELEILTEFDRLCKLGGLKYYVIAGTLLGAVRHRGFIPWDDDIDVAMPRKDFERFAEVCQKHLSPEYFYQSDRTEGNYPFFFHKIRKNETFVDEPSLKRVKMHKGIYLDVFPLDGCPAKDWSGKLFFKWVQQLQCAVMAQVNPEFKCGYKKIYMRALHSLLCRVPRRGLFSLWKLTWVTISACCKKRICTVCGRHGYPAEAYQKEWYRETILLEFEDRKVPAPIGWDAMLTNLYGNYMCPPTLENRQGHFE